MRKTARALGLVTLAGLALSCAELVASAIPAATTMLEAAAINYGGPYAVALKGLVEMLSSAALSDERPSDAQPSVASAPPLSLDVAFVADSGGEPRPLPSVAEVTAGDRMRLFLRPSAEAYVFVVSIDTSGGFRLLYPDSLIQATPLPGGTEVQLPAATSWFQFDGSQGLEHIHIVATRRSADVIVERLSKLVQTKLGVRTRSVDAAVVTVPFRPEASRPERSGPEGESDSARGRVRPRAADVVVPFLAATRRGSPVEIAPIRHSTLGAAQDLVISQIFRHR